MSGVWKMRLCPNVECNTLSTPDRIWCEKCLGDIGSENDITVVTASIDQNTEGKVSRAHGETARKAATEVAPRTGSQRHSVLRKVGQWSLTGVTRDELADYLGLSPNTVRPRVKELLDGGFIEIVPGVTRKSKAGKDAEVLRMTQKGAAALR